jgi:hypothetical protein
MVLMAGAALIGARVPAWAQDPDVKPVTGTYYMAPAMDAEDPKAPVDHMYLTLTGDTAKSMWDAMKVETTPDECIGRMARWVNGLVCYGPATSGSLAAGDSPFECYLGVNLKTAALELGQDC